MGTWTFGLSFSEQQKVDMNPVEKKKLYTTPENFPAHSLTACVGFHFYVKH